VFFRVGEIIARKPEEKDTEEIYRYRNDPDVYQTLGGHYAGMSRADIRDWIEHHRANIGDFVVVLATADDDRCVGHAGLYQIDYRKGKAELGVAIAKGHWGKGIGTGVLKELVSYAFGELRLHRLETFSLEKNDQIKRIKEHLGFTVEGVLRDYEYRDGDWMNVICMSILEPEWKQGRQSK
jgi:RimJ/RimL family protein N-acetyltransferase